VVDIEVPFLTSPRRYARHRVVIRTALPLLTLGPGARGNKAPADAMDPGPILSIRYAQIRQSSVTEL